jgi:hypothetical protein
MNKEKHECFHSSYKRTRSEQLKAEKFISEVHRILLEQSNNNNKKKSDG